MALAERTIGEIRERAKNQASAQIRGMARTVMARSRQPKVCMVCGYNRHVEVSHRRAISDFPLSTKVSVVNDLNNLEYLCPNHHWEHEHPLPMNV